jgi:uncharacterized OB-fold protein
MDQDAPSASGRERFPLFAETGTDALPDRPALIGGRCVCGHPFFPMQHFGCERCGRFAADLAEVRLAGRGELIAFAQVHLHARPYPKVPFTVLALKLDDGPVIRALLDPPVDAELRIGATMLATIVEETRAAQSRKVLRFTRAGA